LGKCHPDLYKAGGRRIGRGPQKDQSALGLNWEERGKNPVQKRNRELCQVGKQMEKRFVMGGGGSYPKGTPGERQINPCSIERGSEETLAKVGDA